MDVWNRFVVPTRCSGESYPELCEQRTDEVENLLCSRAPMPCKTGGASKYPSYLFILISFKHPFIPKGYVKHRATRDDKGNPPSRSTT
jgi:hypothetical protein